MKKYFITGLVILLPVALTFAIVLFIFNLLTAPFLGIVNTAFDRYHLFEQGFLFLNPDQFQNFIAQLLILASLIVIASSLGLIARWFFFKTLMKFAEYLVKHIPLVNTIYQTCQDVIKTIFTSNTSSFKQVVLVRFPNPDTYSIGFITQEEITGFANTPYAHVIAVFVPTTPNPTSGFLMMYQPSELIHLDMKVEDAFKYIISCGVISPPFTTISKESPYTETHTKIEVPT